MRQKQAEKVIQIGAKRKEEVEHSARMFAEAMFKDEPSAEAKAHVDAELDADPDAWRKHGDLARDAMELGFKKFWLGYVTKAGVLRGAEMLKQDFGFNEASPVERLLIEHTVLCHVRLGMVEHQYSRNTTGRMDIAEHWERRLTLAQKRFTRAVTALARVRGLLARAEAAREARARSGRALGILKQMAG
jgi:hypothetical protein